MKSKVVFAAAIGAAALLLFVLFGQNAEEAPVGTSDQPSDAESDDASAGLEGRPLQSGSPGEEPASTPKRTVRVGNVPPVQPTKQRIDRLADANGDDATATLRVRVVDETESPRPDARLLLFMVEKGVGRKRFDKHVGADGEIVVEKLKPGRRAIWVHVGSFQRMTAVELVAGRVTEAVVSVPRGADVAGVVRDAEKGLLAGIQMRLKRSDDVYSDSVFASTDADGRYQLKDIPPGTYAVSLTGDAIGHHPRPRGELVVHASGALEKDFVLGQLALEGFVREAVSGRALGGVRVGLQNGMYVDTTTDPRGWYRFRDVAPGEYTLTASKDGYGFRFIKTGPVSADTVTTLDIELTPAAVLDIEVVDDGANPIAGKVSLSIQPLEPKDGTSLSTSRNADSAGKLRYAQIVPGLYELGISARGFAEVREKVQVAPGTTALRFQLTRTEAEQPVRLRGVIRDAVTKQPIAGVRIKMQSPLRRNAVSDANGAYGFRGPRTGTCVLWVAKDGYGIRYLRGVEVKAGEVTELDVELQSAAVLHLRLTSANGDAVVGDVTLAISPRKGAEGTNLGTGVTADTNGLATYRQIVPGHYTIRVIQESIRASIETEIREGENTLDLRLR